MMHIPPCANPDHPSDSPREKGMVIIRENSKEIAFACETCRDAKGILSVQVITLGHGWNAERKLRGIRRAKVVQKAPTGRVRYFR